MVSLSKLTMLLRWLSLVVASVATPLEVSVDTDWRSAPHVAQTLEVLSVHNSSAFFPLLSLYLARQEEDPIEPLQAGKWLISKAVEGEFISNQESSLVQAEIDLGHRDAFFESQFSQFDALEKKCSQALIYDGEILCDFTDVFALKTSASDKPPVDLGLEEHVIGGALKAPWAVFYGSLDNPDFAMWHSHLLAAAMDHKLTYILRWAPPQDSVNSRKLLAGWNLKVQVKRTDYLVIDDRSSSKSSDEIDLDAPNRVPKDEIPSIGRKLSEYVSSKGTVDDLVDMTLNLPGRLHLLSGVEPASPSRQFPPGANIVLVNGKPVTDFDAFSFIDLLREESRLNAEVVKLGGTPELLGQGIGGDSEYELRYNVPSDSVLWLNDIENDSTFEDWSPTLEPLLHALPGRFPQARRNIHSLVLTGDLALPQTLATLTQAIHIVAQRVPIQVGFIPVGESEQTAGVYNAAELGRAPSQAYILALLNGLDTSEALDAAKEIAESDARESVLEPTIATHDKGRSFAKKFDITDPVVFANGVAFGIDDWRTGVLRTFSSDNELLQTMVEEGVLDQEDESTNIRDLLLSYGMSSRSDKITPANPDNVNFVATSRLEMLPYAEYTHDDGPVIWYLSEFSNTDAWDRLEKAKSLPGTLRVIPTSRDSKVVNAILSKKDYGASPPDIVNIDQYSALISTLSPKIPREGVILSGRSVKGPLSYEELELLLNREQPRLDRVRKAVPAASDVLVSLLASAGDRFPLGGIPAVRETHRGALIDIISVVDPASERGQEIVALLGLAKKIGANITVHTSPSDLESPPNRYLRPIFEQKKAVFDDLEDDVLYVVGVKEPPAWVVMARECSEDLDNLILHGEKVSAKYELRSILIEGYAPKGIGAQLQLYNHGELVGDTMVMSNLGYFQLQPRHPGFYEIKLDPESPHKMTKQVLWVSDMSGQTSHPRIVPAPKHKKWNLPKWGGKEKNSNADINIFTVASGHLYERFLSIMTLSVMEHTKHSVKFWLIESFLSPSFKQFLPTLAEYAGFEYEFVTYKWPRWLRPQSEKQREIWGYKILFLDTLFPQKLDKVIFVDSDQIVRTDLIELVNEDLEGAPYGYTPMGDDRPEMEGFRFWKQGYWKRFLGGRRPYHISALYVIDLDRFREIGAGDRLRQHYQQLSSDPSSLSNLDQDLPNNLQFHVPIHSLDKDWLWCETWCSDEGLKTAKTIDLCNNPLTKEPKLDRARRQIPEWTRYDDTVAELRRKALSKSSSSADPTDTIEHNEL